MKLLLDLGLQPVSNRFLNTSDKSIPCYPLRLMLHTKSGYLHLEQPFPIDELKPRYEWLTCFEPENHLDDLVEKIIALPGIDQKTVFGGYSFKDDSTLERLKVKGFKQQIRIDPGIDLGVSDPCASIETYQAVFNIDKAKQIQKKHGYVDVMIVRHVIEHAYDLPCFIAAIRTMVHPNGNIVWELPDCERALSKGDCTTIWEEHVHYFTRFTFRNLLQNSGFSVIDYDSVSYPLENSIIAIVKNNYSVADTVAYDPNVVAEEVRRAYRFGEKIVQRKKNIRSRLKLFQEKHGRIVMFGAGHLTVAYLSIMEIEDLIDK